jgi:hypothetical protein
MCLAASLHSKGKSKDDFRQLVTVFRGLACFRAGIRRACFQFCPVKTTKYRPAGQLMKTSFYFLLALVLGATACKHKTSEIDPDVEQPGPGLVCPVGAPLGDAVSKQIGPEGGNLQSADGSLTIRVPAGALTTPTDVGIQQLTSTCPAGVGKGWRLTPHGTTFAKPVELTINYEAYQDSVSLPEALGLAYQDGQGVWQFVGSNHVDKVNHKVTVNTSHFSDWSFMSWLRLSPANSVVREGESIQLEARHYLTQWESSAQDGLDLPMPPAQTNGYPVGNYRLLNPRHIRKWSLNGVGQLAPSTNKAGYKAPVSVKSAEVATISLELNVPKGQAFLVSTVTVLGKEPAITYLQLMEKTGPNGRNSELVIYGSNFGAQDMVKSGITINEQSIDSQDIGLWSDGLIVCRIPMIGPGSSGPVRVVTAAGTISEPHLLNEWTVVMESYRPCARIDQTLYHKETIHLRIRGDATVPPDNLQIIGKGTENTVNILSEVHWEAGGRGESVLHNSEACGTETEDWTQVSGEIPLTPEADVTAPMYFKASLWLLPGEGFEVRFNYHANNVVPSHFVYTYCAGDSQVNNRPFSINFPSEFTQDKFHLLFDGSTLKGGSSKSYRTGIGSMNLHSNGSDPNYQPTIKVTWGSAKARF